jgi:hypothetical protein
MITIILESDWAWLLWLNVQQALEGLINKRSLEDFYNISLGFQVYVVNVNTILLLLNRRFPLFMKTVTWNTGMCIQTSYFKQYLAGSEF